MLRPPIALPTRASLFDPLTLRSVTLRNRIVVAPMSQYSSDDGFATPWHLVHLGSRAVGGAGAVITEATAVAVDGRISPYDLGIWKDEHIPGLAGIVEFLEQHGAVPGIQLAHSGRKGSTKRPWQGSGAVDLDDGGWTPVGPTPEAFSSTYPIPEALSDTGVMRIVEAFRAAAVRARRAGFRLAEIHAAHGYVLHQFLSPLVNARTDRWGGPFENRVRLALEVTRAVRAVWPQELPLWLRVSATDWAEGGWDLEQTIQLAKLVRGEGVDLVDCSSGGAVAHQQITTGPGYQVTFAGSIRREAGVRTGAVGLITEPAQAQAVLQNGDADVVLLARESLRDPYWPLHAAQALGAPAPWPSQYLRAKP